LSRPRGEAAALQGIRPCVGATAEAQRLQPDAASHIKGRWIALQGAIDQVCLPGPTQAFVAQVPGAELVMLPHVGHGYSVERNWMPQ